MTEGDPKRRNEFAGLSPQELNAKFLYIFDLIPKVEVPDLPLSSSPIHDVVFMYDIYEDHKRGQERLSNAYYMALLKKSSALLKFAHASRHYRRHLNDLMVMFFELGIPIDYQKNPYYLNFLIGVSHNPVFDRQTNEFAIIPDEEGGIFSPSKGLLFESRAYVLKQMTTSNEGNKYDKRSLKSWEKDIKNRHNKPPILDSSILWPGLMN